MDTASDIIAALGGTSAVARELDLPPSTVPSWKSGAGIPRWRMPGVQAMAARLKIDLTATKEDPAPSPGNSAEISPEVGEAGDE